MTGQVKEEILTRRGELGVALEAGALRFEPVLLGGDEFSAEPGTFEYVDLRGDGRTLPLPAGSLAWTLCQVPVVYVRGGDRPWVQVTLEDGAVVRHPGTGLDAPTSARVLGRRGGVAAIEVGIPEAAIRRD